MNISISDAMISAAQALRSGAAENIVAMALRSDGLSPKQVGIVLRWCKLYNERTDEDGNAIEND